VRVSWPVSPGSSSYFPGFRSETGHGSPQTLPGDAVFLEEPLGTGMKRQRHPDEGGLESQVPGGRMGGVELGRLSNTALVKR
jgi:hypothetical protein